MSDGASLLEIARAFATSPSFWQQTVPLSACALASLGALIAFMVLRMRRARRRVSRLVHSEHGSAQAMDFVLTFPIALLVMYLFIQFLMAAQASLVVHYAAYVAARTARTMYWDVSVDEVRAEQVRERLLGDNDTSRRQYWRVIRSRNEGRARSRAAIAARVALMAAVPASQVTPGRVSADAAVVLKEVNSLSPRTALRIRSEAGRNKAIYAFVPANARIVVDVDAQYERALLIFQAGSGPRVRALPIQAEVTFRYPLRMPVGRFFGTPAPGGGYYRDLEARVVLL